MKPIEQTTTDKTISELLYELEADTHRSLKQEIALKKELDRVNNQRIKYMSEN